MTFTTNGRKWINNGDHNSGWLTDERCPKDKARVLYNGNYFCENWNNGCDWALPHPPTELADKQISFRLQGYWEVSEDEVSREEPT